MPTKIAVLDESLPEQMKTNPREMADCEIVWTGTSADELEARASLLRPGVLVLDLDRLGPEPLERTRKLQQLASADLVLILYKFAKRDVVDKLADQGTRPMKAPVSLAALRMQMMSVIVKNIFKKEERASEPEMILPGPPPPARVFTSAQLGRLQEISSTIGCECTNHVADILQLLNGFEDYSLRCQSKDDKDAQIHHLLYVHTGQARSLLEEALRVLIKYENIAL